MKILIKILIVSAFISLTQMELNAQPPVNKHAHQGDSTRRDNTAVRNATAKKASPHFGKDLDSSKQKNTTGNKGKKDTMYLVPEKSKRSKK